jgi:hypothetical protein
MARLLHGAARGRESPNFSRLLAASIPASRAARLDPMQTLRQD